MIVGIISVRYRSPPGSTGEVMVQNRSGDLRWGYIAGERNAARRKP